MDSESNQLMIDAQATDNINESLPKAMNNLQLSSVLDDLTIEECKSMYFLLMDHVGEDEYLSIIKQDEAYLKEKLIEILKKMSCESIFIELLATMKKFDKLRKLGTCQHICEELNQKKFNNIDGVLKMLYLLSEELSDSDLKVFKDCLPDIKNEIITAEDWFFWALRRNLISKTKFSELEKIFKNFPNCEKIIKSFALQLVQPKTYDIKTPAENVHCGVAVILNYEKFNGEYPDREGSNIDVNALLDVWNQFGFKTELHHNLTFNQTVMYLRHYAVLDHSKYDAFVCCILSHGLPNSVISSDGIAMPIPLLIAQITNNCATLNLKPKLFFIQACQGRRIQQGFGKPVYEVITPDMSVPSAVDLIIPPVAADVLLALSTISGYVSFRSRKHGSWFIEAFCTVMKQKGHLLSILDVMIEVNDVVRMRSADFGEGRPRNAQQIVNCHNTFGKVLTLKKRIN